MNIRHVPTSGCALRGTFCADDFRFLFNSRFEFVMGIEEKKKLKLSILTRVTTEIHALGFRYALDSVRLSHFLLGAVRLINSSS